MKRIAEAAAADGGLEVRGKTAAVATAPWHSKHRTDCQGSHGLASTLDGEEAHGVARVGDARKRAAARVRLRVGDGDPIDLLVELDFRGGAQLGVGAAADAPPLFRFAAPL